VNWVQKISQTAAVVRGDLQSDGRVAGAPDTEAFPWDSAPKYLIRDNDRAFGVAFKARVRAMGIRDRPTSYCSLWQNGYVERLVGSIRRECTDHLLVLNVELSFPKIQSGGIRALRQNQRIIRCDVCDHPPTRNVYSRSVQATTPA
jgi:hypothetical protein